MQLHPTCTRHALAAPGQVAPENHAGMFRSLCACFLSVFIRVRLWLRRKSLSVLRHRPELLFFALAICVANAPLLTGHWWQALTFQPEAVRAGQWWRLLTHPFVHVTWYHLLLDGAAFFVLYVGLLEKSLGRRLACILGAAIGSLAAAWSSPTAAMGLCGLSGVAHGLMAISALELLSARKPHSAEWRVGLATFALVVGKAAYEALAGRMFFAFLDFGLLGSPVSVSHAGGIMGGITMSLILSLGKTHKSRLLRGEPRPPLGGSCEIGSPQNAPSH